MSAKIKSSVGDNFPASFAVPEIFGFWNRLLDMSIDISHNICSCQAPADGKRDARFILRKCGGQLDVTTDFKNGRKRHTMSKNKFKKKFTTRKRAEQNRPA